MDGKDAESRALVWQWLECCLEAEDELLPEKIFKVLIGYFVSGLSDH